MTGEWEVKADLNFESSTSSVSKKQIFTAKYYWSIWLAILAGISYMNLYDSCPAFFLDFGQPCIGVFNILLRVPADGGSSLEQMLQG